MLNFRKKQSIEKETDGIRNLLKTGYRVCISATALLLTSCSMFSNKEVSATPVSQTEAQTYFRASFLGKKGISFETENFLESNLLMDRVWSEPVVVLQTIQDYYDVTHDIRYLLIAADLCNGIGKYSSDPEKSIRFQLAGVFYCRSMISARKTPLGPLDPATIQMMLIYNESSLGIFSYLKKHNLLKNDSVTLLDIERRRFILQKGVFHSPLPAEAFTDFDSVAHYSVQKLRLKNRHFGLGVPLIGYVKMKDIYKSLRTPAGMTVPVTLLLQMLPQSDNTYLLQPVYVDTLMQEEYIMPVLGYASDKIPCPLTLDYSTPLAVFLNGLQDKNLISVMLHPDEEEKNTGLYMVEPFNPDKIPVVFVHGLMSSPGTWVEMINTLKNDPVIRQKYQFWFFLYSSGMPVLLSAQTLRTQLLAAYDEFAVDAKTRANFDKMVMVGHSMGGLVTRTLMQKDPQYLAETISGQPWKTFSQSWTPEEKAELEKILLVPSLPFVHRVVFMAVPHKGSEMATWSIARLGTSLVKMPLSTIRKVASITAIMAKHGQKTDALDRQKKHIATGIDNLDPDNPYVKALGSSPLKSDLIYHSIIGNAEADDQPGGSDGIVPYWSSHLDGAASEWIVRSGHSVHCAPGAIRELLRILRLHLEESGTLTK